MPLGNRKPAINISPASAADRTASPQRDQTSSSVISRPTSRTGESIQAFEDRTLSAIFKITLKEDQQRDVHGQKLVYLPGLKGELEEQGADIRFSVDSLDQALLEAASNAGKQTPLEYLVPCWKRVSRLHKGFKKPNNEDPKFAIVKEARRLCMSYCIFAASMPEMFG
jgi:ubiquitin conjugation factor E4 B